MCVQMCLSNGRENLCLQERGGGRDGTLREVNWRSRVCSVGERVRRGEREREKVVDVVIMANRGLGGSNREEGVRIQGVPSCPTRLGAEN